MSVPGTPIPTKSGDLLVHGCQVRWSEFGTGAETMLLLHGGGAHSGWWTDTAYALRRQRQVVLMDLSGHGDSGRRRSYSYDLWVAEIVAVIERVCDQPVTLVCHSMSGRAGVLTAARHPELVEALVLVDSVIPMHDREPAPRNQPLKVYPSHHEAVRRFRLAPAAGPTDPAVLSDLANRSLREVPGGWSWKFDPVVFDATGAEDINPSIRAIGCPVACVLGADSPVTNLSMLQALEVALGRELAAAHVVAGADHHFMVEMPDVAADVLAGLPLTKPHVPTRPAPRPSRTTFTHI